jgi:glycerol-3-phosphate dehydrogenase subunit C
VNSYHVPVERSLDACIKCNICVTKCPVTKVTDLFPGPKYEGPQAGRFRLTDFPSPDSSVDFCSGCRICNLACPTGVRIAEINARARAHMVASGKFSLRTRLRNNILGRSELIGKLGQPIAPVANALLANRPIRQLVALTLQIHEKAPLPAFSHQRFSAWFHNRRQPLRSEKKIVYFHGCSTEYYEPWVGKAAVQVLEANGYEVIVPPQNCCGLPLLSNGEFAAARRYQTSNLRSLFGYANRGIPIVGTSTSCTLTLKEEAIELLDYHEPEAFTVAAQVFDIHEFLRNLRIEGSMNLALGALPFEIPYHIPCQFQAHRVGSPTYDILSMIPGLKILESPSACCGICGTYGYKSEKYQISQDVGAPLFEFVRSAGAPFAACDSETCRWQIARATGIPTVHPIEILAAAYGLEIEGMLPTILTK